jgi:phospholipase/lecithinase/hemolysin
MPVPLPIDVVSNITAAIQNLYSLGARNFLVPNLPDIGLSPLLQEAGPAFSELAKTHNETLSSALDGLAATLPDINIVRVDVYTLTSDLKAAGMQPAPALGSISPGTAAVTCLFINPATCPDVDLSAATTGFLFWDALHPTTEIHQLVAKAMYDQLTK